MHFDEEMGFQFLGPRSIVLSPSDPTVFFTRFQPYDLHFFLCFFSQSDHKVGFLWQVQDFRIVRLDFCDRCSTL